MMADAQRADPFADLDLGEFAPTKPARPTPAAVREVSEANNFPSRAPRTADPIKRQLRRRRTGRNVQLNLKVTQAAADRFAKMADEQGLSFGELFDRALDALEGRVDR